MTTTVKAVSFTTTEAYISGGICGHLWMPHAMAGSTLRVNLRGPWGIWDRFTEPPTMREALDSLLMDKGGDFQDAKFTADTRMVIVRRRIDGSGRYTVHVREREISQLRDCADLVNADAYTGDFMGDDE